MTHGAVREEEDGGREGEGFNPTDLPRTGGRQPTNFATLLSKASCQSRELSQDNKEGDDSMPF